MRAAQTLVVAEIAVLIALFVLVIWLESVLTVTRHSFVTAVLFWGAYAAVRITLSVRKRRAGAIGSH
jgi:hypothetical protein